MNKAIPANIKKIIAKNESLAPLSIKDTKTAETWASGLAAIFESLPEHKRELSAKEVAAAKRRIAAHARKRRAAFGGGK